MGVEMIQDIEDIQDQSQSQSEDWNKRLPEKFGTS